MILCQAQREMPNRTASSQRRETPKVDDCESSVKPERDCADTGL